MDRAMTLGIGKQLFEKIQEYPLAKQPGVRDYLFYFVPSNDGYGKGARAFFNRFYRHHVTKDARSLQDIVEALHQEVTTAGVRHIREVILVAHGTVQGLIAPILNNASGETMQEYKYLTAFSLACLQQDFLDGKFPDFQAKRRTILPHLQNDSWITVRACNFGQSREGLYALHSFWGGKPNVYAPTDYQFFGSQPIMEGMRFETRLEVHGHLAKQRFLAGDMHSPERKDAIVRALSDPASFSERFALISMRIDDPEPEEAQRYEGVIDALDAGRVPSSIQSTFAEQGFPLSSRLRVSVVDRHSAWLLKDVITHEGSQYRIDYRVYEEVALSEPGNRRRAKLWTEAALVATPSAHESFPLQLFFYQGDHDLWRGRLFTLAFHTEDADADPRDKQKFDAVMALLNTKRFRDESGTGVDIRAEFSREHQIELSGNATIALVSGPDSFGRITWVIRDQQAYLVKLEHPSSSNGIPTHTITVYEHPDKASQLTREYELMSFLGISPDTPGTELAAYLDRLSLDELAALIDYARAAYKPAYALYLHHAQQALRRKKGFGEWMRRREPDFAFAVLPTGMSYSELSLSEREDKRAIAYDFEFNGSWHEVKSADPPATPAQNDLFAEERLGPKFKIPEEALVQRTNLPNLEPDSPYTDLEELRTLDRIGFAPMFSVEKHTFDPVKDTDELSCEEFAAVIAKWKEVDRLAPDEIRAILAAQRTSTGESYLDIIQQLGSHYSLLRNMGKLVELFKLPVIPVTGYSISKEITKQVVKRVPVLARIALLSALFEVVWVFEVPFKMWMKFLEAQEDAARAWENKAKLTAVRQWLSELLDLTYLRESDFPDRLDIDISTPVSAEPYYIGRYYAQQVNDHGRYFRAIFAPEAMKRGYDKGAEMMPAVGTEILRHAEEAIGGVLQGLKLDSCKISVLNDAGFIDLTKLKALVVRQLTRALLDQLPKV